MLDDMDTDDIARMLRDSAQAITRDGLSRARRLRFAEPGFDRVVWAQMAGLGWFGLRLSEDQGGSGLGMAALGGLMQELGGVLTPEPVVETLLAARLLADVAPELCASVVGGETLAVVAWAEGPGALETSSREARRVFVPASGADVILVPVARGGAVHLMRHDAGALDVETEGLVDGGFTSTIRLDGAEGEDLGPLPDGLLAEALDEAALAAGFYMAGMSAAALEMTLDYLRERKQFGVPIGSFQALQHRAVDEVIESELATASCTEVAALIDAGRTGDARARDVSRAVARASETASRVTRAAVQLHGGIGYTDEYDVGLFLRKAMVLANAWGTPAWHRKRYARLIRTT